MKLYQVRYRIKYGEEDKVKFVAANDLASLEEHMRSLSGTQGETTILNVDVRAEDVAIVTTEAKNEPHYLEHGHIVAVPEENQTETDGEHHQ